uniref:Uncharacterized protein LOC100182137 n=1 Tax=Phallusia mammillata TaxID=59560 RepID=A0A6F9DI53_9ASCI|nr:uncharacterized protein LOC100182137 [Phallusia mammillata]
MEMSGLKHALQNLITAKTGQQTTFPLQVTKQENVKPEKFGNASSWSFRKQTDKNEITAENLFDEAARTCAEKAKSSHETIIKPRHNIAGVTGIAGVGKTTFCKSVAKQWMETHPESFVFYISSRDLNFKNQEKYNVLKFLLASTVHSLKHSPESGKLLLEKIEKSSDTLIVIDGLDEAKHKGNFFEYPSAVELFDEKESAYNILMNLLNGRLLPNAKKLIASRPFAFQHFHPECRPLFMAHVLGLSPESQILLCKEVCETDEQQVILQEELEKQPNISALCFIPMFGKMIVKNFFENLESGKSIRSICEIFLNQFEHWQRNPKFKTDVQFIPKLAKLAFDGIQTRQFQFTTNNLKKYGLVGNSIEPFMSVHTESSKEPGLMILDGEEMFFFIHATWQEFLAALYLMVFASNEEFSAKVEDLLKEGHWEVVTRFLFGFCHQQTQAKLQAIFADDHDVRDKEKLLKTKLLRFLPDMLENLPADFPVSAAKYFSDVKSMITAEELNSRENVFTLFNICSWAYEAQDDNLTKAVSNSLPSPLLLSGDILPHEIVCFCHVLLAAEEPHILNVGTWPKLATFIGAGLQTLLNTVQQSKHKVSVENYCVK